MRNNGDHPLFTWAPALFFVAIAALPIFMAAEPQHSVDAALEGEWLIDFEAYEANAQADSPDFEYADDQGDSSMSYIFEDGALLIGGQGHYVTQGRYTVDAETDPKQIDITYGVPSNGSFLLGVIGALAGETTLKGVYKIEGDRLIIHQSYGEDRPTDFEETKSGYSQFLYLKRPPAEEAN